MATLVNIRIHTQSKAVPNANDITIEEVSLIGNTIIAKDDEGVVYELGVISAENIVVETPPAVSDCGNTTTNANIFATLVKGVDGVTPDMSDYYDKEVIDEKLGKKQDAISDLDAIRRGAEKGATAVQPASLADYISKDDVDAELSETSTNPIQNKAVEEALADLANAVGIFLAEKQPIISDLEAIRDGATKGATALQSSDVDSEVSETSTNPVQNKAVAGALTEIVGLLEATFSIVDERFKSKQDKLVSGENIKTINGESIIGEGNIVIEGGGSADLEGYATEEYVDNAVEAVDVKGEDGYVYSNGEKVDMRFTRSLIPVGTSIPAKANLNTVAYLKVGKYYCSLNADAKTITNCPTANAFMMEVFNLLSTVVDNEVDSTYVYRIRIITEYSTGIQYFQYCTVGSTANKWTYDSWYVCPRTKFTLNSNKNDGSAAIGSKTQGVYVDSTGTLQKMTYSLNKTVPSSAVFTDTDTKVTDVGNHYTPAENADEALNAPEGEVVVGLKRDAAGHVVGVMSTPMSGNAGGGGGGGIAVETDPIFSASPAASITDEKMAEWDNKQDTIADLETIRSNASKGATAVQPGDIENVARLDEEYVMANGIVSEEDVYYHLPNTNTSDAAHTLATKGDLSSTIETYIADFTMGSLREGMINGSYVNCDMQALVAAMNANKIILVRDEADSSCKGVYVLNGYAEDLLYFSIVDSAGNVLYCDGTDYVYTKSYINGQTLFYRSWADKQDKLQSGENIKTINGENILGSGDITIGGGVGTITEVSANGTSIATSGVADIPAASTSKYGVTKLTTLTNSSSTTLAATASAVKIAYDLANSKQDRLESGTNIKTINGESILGEGDMLVGKITYFSEEDIIELSPNVVWLRRGSVVNSVQITGFASNGKDYEEYAYHFYTGTIADGSIVKLILPEGVKYANKEIFDALESDTHYELSVVRSNGVVKAVLTAFK